MGDCHSLDGSGVKTTLIDLALAEIDGVIRWPEYIRGERLDCMFDARHLGRVLKAKEAQAQTVAWFAGGGSLKEQARA